MTIRLDHQTGDVSQHFLYKEHKLISWSCLVLIDMIYRPYSLAVFKISVDSVKNSFY